MYRIAWVESKDDDWHYLSRRSMVDTLAVAHDKLRDHGQVVLIDLSNKERPSLAHKGKVSRKSRPSSSRKKRSRGPAARPSGSGTSKRR